MNRLLLALTVLVLLNGSPSAAQQAPTSGPTAIRDIRGPLETSGLPPFTGTVLVLLVAALYLAVTAKRRKGRGCMVAPPPVPTTAMDDLAAVRNAYAQGELPALQLFEQLAGICRSLLIRSDGRAMTSAEVLTAAGETVPAELIAVAATLFAVCDRVRFGGSRPDIPEVAEAFAAVQLLLERRPGGTS
jgi:hypothetical protein